MPRVSVIIPCRNEAVHITTSIRTILAQNEPDGGFEVIIADGMSDDGTREILNHFAKMDSRIIVIDNPGHFVPTGLNCALKVARGDIIVRMDVHTEYAEDYIQQCLTVLNETESDNVGGAWIPKGTGYLSEAIAVAFQSPFSAGGARSHDIGFEGFTDTVYLGCWFKEIHEKVGYFDEELVRNQDDEFNLRLIRSGGKVWQSPRIKSWYVPRDSLRALFRQYRQYGYWKIRVIQKHKLPASIRHIIPGTFMLYLMLSLFTMPFFYIFKVTTDNQALLYLQNITTNIFFLTVGLYATLVLFASICTTIKSNWKYFPILPIVFGCYHMGYGIGFVEGIIDFVILKRFPDKSKTKITR